MITQSKVEGGLKQRGRVPGCNDFSATVTCRSIPSSLNQIFNHPICARSTFLYEQILLIKFLHLLEDEIPSPF